MINILTFTPVWQRPEVFDICLKGIERLISYDRSRFNIRPFFMISENWAANVLMKYGYDFIFVKNDPLGAKKNEGLAYALKNFDFDYILEIGSDDLIASAWLDRAEPLLKNGVLQIHPSSVYFVDSRTGDIAFWETQKIMGAGRLISRWAIQKVTSCSTFWDPNGRRGMDTFSWKQLLMQNIGNHIVITREVYALDIKSDVNINQMKVFAKSPFPLETILAHFPEGESVFELINTNTYKTFPNNSGKVLQVV